MHPIHSSPRRLKVPEITAAFWLLKLLTTALGESFSDFSIQVIDPVVAVSFGFIAFAIMVVIQIRASRYIPALYWATVLLVAVFGTMAADVLHVGFGIPYIISTLFFAASLVVVFSVWRQSEGTLSIHSIKTVRKEIFYWLTVVTTFALGTAAGDLTAITLNLGYLGSIVLFGAVILVPLIGRLRFKWNEVFAFWFAYILTRPLGASIADWTGRGAVVGGLGLGDGIVSTILFVALCIGVVRISVASKARRSTPQ